MCMKEALRERMVKLIWLRAVLSKRNRNYKMRRKRYKNKLSYFNKREFNNRNNSMS